MNSLTYFAGTGICKTDNEQLILFIFGILYFLCVIVTFNYFDALNKNKNLSEARRTANKVGTVITIAILMLITVVILQVTMIGTFCSFSEDFTSYILLIVIGLPASTLFYKLLKPTKK